MGSLRIAYATLLPPSLISAKLLTSDTLIWKVTDVSELSIEINDPLFCSGGKWTGFPLKPLGSSILAKFSCQLPGLGVLSFSSADASLEALFNAAKAAYEAGKLVKKTYAPFKENFPPTPSSNSTFSTPARINRPAFTTPSFIPAHCQTSADTLRIDKLPTSLPPIKLKQTKSIDSLYASSIKKQRTSTYSSPVPIPSSTSRKVLKFMPNSTIDNQTPLTHFTQHQKHKSQEGYINVGYSCYMASCLHFIQALTLSTHPHPENKFTQAYGILQQQRQHTQSVDPYRFKKTVEALFGWGSSRQEDVHEYFLSCASYLAGFEWTMRKRITCCNSACTYANEVFEMFNDLSVDGADVAGTSFVLLLSQQGFFADETVELLCECKHTTARIVKSVKTSPPCLVIHLKRFGGTTYVRKKDGSLAIKKRIDLKEFGGAVYLLKSIVNHWGRSADKGHYTCDVKTKEGWASFDDNMRIDCEYELQKERGSAWYLLGYVREDLYQLRSSAMVWR